MNISEIKAAYLTGDQSLTALAEQAGMSRKTLARQAQAEGWQAARAAYRQEMTDALLSRSKAQALQQDADAPAPPGAAPGGGPGVQFPASGRAGPAAAVRRGRRVGLCRGGPAQPAGPDGVDQGAGCPPPRPRRRHAGGAHDSRVLRRRDRGLHRLAHGGGLRPLPELASFAVLMITMQACYRPPGAIFFLLRRRKNRGRKTPRESRGDPALRTHPLGGGRWHGWLVWATRQACKCIRAL